MHIKQVIISGFRSFKSQNEIEPFSPQHNVIVGRNGSGKSNLFNAIQFVLIAPKFANLRQEERQSLLHEGSGASVMAAYVEIVFDNADGRLSVDADEVVIRRTIGHKKDEFFLNRKRTQKSEILSMLESAGFSKSNPYYIVQQGKVATLCTMKDADRLNLLKEIAGTNIYEEKRNDSLKLLTDCKNKQTKINEIITYITTKLEELEAEKEELQRYDMLSNRKNCMEYNLYDNELRMYHEQMEHIEIIIAEKRAQQHELFILLRNAQEELTNIAGQLQSSAHTIESLSLQKNTYQLQHSSVLQQLTQQQALLADTRSTLSTSTAHTAQLQQTYDALLQSIAETESQLAALAPQNEQLQNALAAKQKELNSVSQQMEHLYSKQGRSHQFTSLTQRNSYLNEQITYLQNSILLQQDQLETMEGAIATENERLTEEKAQLQRMTTEQTMKQSVIDADQSRLKALITERNSMQEKRKDIWKRYNTNNDTIAKEKVALESQKQVLFHSLPRSTSQSLMQIERIVAEHKINGYYGTVMDNISLTNEVFATAVEVAAGSALFHVIVANDQVARQIITELEKRKIGRLTFLPLNKLKVPEVVYPESNDVRPLMQVALTCDESVELAIKQVFSRKLLARDLDTAAKFSREFNLDAITRDGDIVNRKGGFEGGYHDDRHSRINAMSKVKHSSVTIAALTEENEVLMKESAAIDASMNSLLNQIHTIEIARDQNKSEHVQLLKEYSLRQKQYEQQAAAMSKRQSSIRTIADDISSKQEQIASYQRELKTKLNADLTPAETQQLNNLTMSKQRLQEEVAQLESSRQTSSAQFEKIRLELRENLLKQKLDLEVALSSTELRDTSSIELLIDQLQQQVSSLETDIAAINTQLSKERRHSDDLRKREEQLSGEEQELRETMTAAATEHDKLYNKRNILNENITVKQRLLRDLGLLSTADIEKYRNYSEKQLLAELKKCNEELSQYTSINKKAFDQYSTFNQHKKTLLERKSTLEHDYAAIEMLIASLDNQKDEIILGTFNSMSIHFTQVFAELVPGGQGQLIMLTDEGADSNVVSSFVGVSIQVSFADSGQVFEMQQLSGGQKALVALALIFAIQRCDPAPFYLFDEIDQALDATHRAAVARLIQEQAHSNENPAQFITTTFRPEMVAAADKCYGIVLENKVSNITPLEKEEAQNFVTSLLSEEEALTHSSSALPTRETPVKSNGSTEKRKRGK